MYQPEGVKGAGENYPAFRVADAEQTRQFLLDSWTSPEQRAYNKLHRTCPECNGQGYRILRAGRTVERENVGCQTCNGTGGVLRDLTK
jgi:hypothetical protein